MSHRSLLSPPASLSVPADREVVLESRVRLSRNLTDTLFPWRASISELHETRDRLLPLVQNLETPTETLLLEELSGLELSLMAERDWLDRTTSAETTSAAVVSREGSTVFTINDADHLRISCAEGGLAVASAWEKVAGYERALDTAVDWSASLELGYGTAYTGEAGAGLVAQVRVFIPGIVEAKVLERVLRALSLSGVQARFWGGEKEEESVYLTLSCVCPFGKTEEEFLSDFTLSIGNLIDGERRTRERLLSSRASRIEDRAWRAAALLSSSRLLPEAEARSLIADLRMGLCYGLSPRFFEPLPVLFGRLDALYCSVSQSQIRLALGPDRMGADTQLVEAARSQLVRGSFPSYDME